MKADIAIEQEDDILPGPTEPAGSIGGDFAALFKLRLNNMVLVTTAIGYLIGERLAGRPTWDGLLLLQTLLGTWLCAAGASALNEAWEWRLDAKMSRTADRPVPAGRVGAKDAAGLGLIFTLCGSAMLLIGVNALSAVLAVATVALYVLVYTPLKRITTLNTLVGAVPGAIPPMIGYVAATGLLDAEAWVLFAILFCWQIPHFLAIAILCRDDYAAAGFKMLPVVSRSTLPTNIWSVGFAIALVAASLLPVWVRPTGMFYIVTTLLLGGGFLLATIYCAVKNTRPAARVAFLSSIIYLPLALGVLLIDRLT